MHRKRARKFQNLRINLICVIFLVFAVIFIVRLFYIQVLGHEKYKALAQEQHWQMQIIPSKRGDILSSDGFILAGTQTHYLMYAEPHKMENKSQTAEKLCTTLVEIYLEDGKYLQNMGYTDLDNQPSEQEIFGSCFQRVTKLLNMELYWVAIERDLDPSQKDELENLEIGNIGFEPTPVRYYPEKTLASHILGFIASDEKGNQQGYFGIEGQFDGDLRGKEGRVMQEKDALGSPILLGGYDHVDSIDGRDVVLTINRGVQHLVERKLEEGIMGYEAVSGSVIVMDPKNSDIMAMANYPTYDPGNIVDEEPIEEGEVRKKFEMRNLSISDTYEPGSVIKPLTISAAVDLRKVSPSTTFNDEGPVQYSDYVIDNWDERHHGVQTIVQLLQKSNNIGAAWVGHLVGSEKLFEYFKEFGLGEKTGVDLEGEDSGILRDYTQWTDIDLATAAFGQGISATPLQVLNAFNVIANGGMLYRPRIVSGIYDEGEYIEMASKEVGRVISESTARTVTDMLVEAVEGGEAKYFNIERYKVAGKTGTAQIPKEGKYDPNSTNATFVGYMPNSGVFSMIVRIDRPSSSVYAAETAVPLWMEIAEELVNYFGIPPDK